MFRVTRKKREAGKGKEEDRGKRRIKRGFSFQKSEKRCWRKERERMGNFSFKRKRNRKKRERKGRE
jgi:hypothetical protein